MTANTGAKLLLYRLRNLKGLLCNLADPPVVVFCYHRVASLRSDPNQLAVTPENFRAQIRFLKERFHLVRFEEDWSGVAKPAAVITFDDGYADNLIRALPILAEEGVPATFFISTGQIETGGEFWWDTLERCLLADAPRPARLELEAAPGTGWSTASAREREVAYRQVHRLLLKASAPQRGHLLEQLVNWAGVEGSAAENAVLNREQVRELAAAPGVTVGAHTESHPQLSSLDEAQQRREIAESRRQLEQLIGREVRVFAYPFGRHIDYDERSLRLCREAGYLKAAAAFPGEAHRWTDPFQIPRHFVYNWDLATFRHRLQRLWV